MPFAKYGSTVCGNNFVDYELLRINCCAADSRLPTNIKARLLEFGKHLLSQIHGRLMSGLESNSWWS